MSIVTTGGEPGQAAALAEASRLRAAGQLAAAARVLERCLEHNPAEPRALNMLGTLRLAEGDFATAATAFERAASIDPAAPILLNLALARNGLADVAGEREALDRALAADPYFQLAMFHLGRWLLRHESAAAAAAAFGKFLATFAPGAELAPVMAAAVAEAQSIVEEEGARLGAKIDAAFAMPPSPRVRAAADIFSGRRPIYRSQPINLYIPYLPELPFFAREQFPWLAELEAGAKTVADELAGVLADEAGLEPYIAFEAGVPLNQWRELNNSRAWSALHLWRHGQPDVANQARCPQTTALAARLPLLDLPGRGPNVMFSILSPGAHIPPHTGSSNARATVHLPLVVPDGCALRVGAETREWRVGEALAFDDTIEHEAWNRSAAPRAILIVDAWNPYLSETDRDGVRTLTDVIESHAGRSEWSA